MRTYSWVSSAVKINAKIFVGNHISAYPVPLPHSISGHSVILLCCPIYKYDLTHVASLGTLPTMDTLHYFSRCSYFVTLLSLQRGGDLLFVVIEQSQANCVDPWCFALVHLLISMCTSCGFADVSLHLACGLPLQDSWIRFPLVSCF